MAAMNQPQFYALTEKRRQLILRVWNNEGGLLHRIMPIMHYLDCHFPSTKLDYALEWLIANNIRGKKFLEFYSECGESMLELHRQLLARIQASDPGKIYAGKDFRT